MTHASGAVRLTNYAIREPALFEQVLAAMEIEVMRGNSLPPPAAAHAGDGIDSLRFREVMS